ncbi:amidase, partial [Amycolatopsis jejuensis]|uniref:amidase n=1 Tax=Amycolatopsis jejuensis TaxID=330084 RepID=UPI00138E120F
MVVVEEVLERIAGLDSVVGSLVTVMGEEALAAARVVEGELARGLWRGPLHGVPLSVKDLIFVGGVRCTGGSRALGGFVPGFDAGVVERLRLGGAVVVGKAQTYEFAMGPGTGYPFGRTRNPWDLERVTVGSSSGSAAGVSARLVFGSLGTDTGGSVRGPASGCGVVGLKPSAGRVGRFGVLPLSWSLDEVGVLAREVVDVALVLGVVEGFDGRDAGSVGLVPVDVGVVSGGVVGGLRFGVGGGFFVDGVDPEFRSALEAAVGVLTEAGMVRTSVE